MGMGVKMEDGGGDEEGGNESIVAEINITPLTDVFLVLLIIFMVGAIGMVETEKATRSGIKVALPKAKTAGPASQKRTDPVLTITKNNEIYLFTKKITPETIESEIRQALKDVGSDTVLVRGDTSLSLGTTVDVIALARSAGATNVVLVTENKEGGGGQ